MRTRTSISALTLGVVVIALLPACSSKIAEATESTEGSTSRTLPTTSEIEAIYNTWSDAVKTGDPDTVNALYADDGVLLPTVSPGVFDSVEERRGYFEFFFQNKPVGVVTEGRAQPLSSTLAAYSGLYTFTLGTTGEVIPARFTYVFQRESVDDQWKIIDHHSSKEPVGAS